MNLTHLLKALICALFFTLTSHALYSQALFSGRGLDPRITPVPVPAVQAPIKREAVPTWVDLTRPDESALQSLPWAPLRLLLSDVQVKLTADSQTQFTRTISHIVTSAGMESASQVQIEFDPSYETVVWHTLQIKRGDQTLDRLDLSRVKLLHREPQLQRQLIDGRLTATLILDDLRVGDLVEFAYSVIGANPVFEGRYVGHRWMVRSIGPSALIRYRLLAPGHRNIRLVGLPSVKGTNKNQVTEKFLGDLRETVVQRVGVPQYEYDPQIVPSSDLADLLQVAEFQDWADVTAWAQRLFQQAYQEKSPSVMQMANELRAKGDGSETARATATLDFVQKEIRYFGTETGVNTHRPASPQAVLMQRFGDCKDKVALFIALLQAQGIYAYPVLVNTQMAMDLHMMMPSPLSFDHAVVIAVVDGTRYLLDPTRSNQTGPLGKRLPTSLPTGLEVNNATTKLTALFNRTMALHSYVTNHMVFSRWNEDPLLTIEHRHFGDAGEGVKNARNTNTLQAIERQLVSDYTRAFGPLDITKNLSFEELTNENGVVVRMQFRLRNYLQLNENLILMGQVALPGLMNVLRLADKSPRENAMVFAIPGRYKHILNVEFPGFTLKYSPKVHTEEKNSRYALEVTTESSPAWFSRLGVLDVTADRISSQEWRAHVDSLEKVWPWLQAHMIIPSLLPSGQNSLEAQISRERDQFAKGNSIHKNELQLNSQIMVYDANAQLGSGRLPAHLRSKYQFLLSRSLQTLGQFDLADQALKEGLQASPEDPSLLLVSAENALYQKAWAQAIGLADKTLVVKSDLDWAKLIKVYALHLSGNSAKAKELLSNLERNRVGWYALLQYLWSTPNELPRETFVSQYLRKYPHDDWTFTLFQRALRQISIEQALVIAGSNPQLSPSKKLELYYVEGLALLREGQPVQALESFKHGHSQYATQNYLHVFSTWQIESLSRKLGQ